MGGEQDMRKMGGLRKKIPVDVLDDVHRVRLPLPERPGFSGLFFSKDEILEETLRASPPLQWALGLLTAGLTSFYMFRLLFLTFFGTQRFDEHHVHVHESPRSMLVPLVVLAILAVAGGWMAAPALLGRRESLRSLPGSGPFSDDGQCDGRGRICTEARRMCSRPCSAPR